MILVAEDVAVIALSLRDALKATGRRVVLVQSADDARRIVTSELPKAAVIDLALADGLTGKELAASLAARGTPVVVVTGYGDSAEHREGLEFCRAVLTKPFAEDYLLQVVETVLAEPVASASERVR